MRRIGIEWFFLQTRRISSQHANMEHSIWQEYPVCPVMPIVDCILKKISEHCCGDISFCGIHVWETWGLSLEAHKDHSRPQVRCSSNQFIILDHFELYLCHFCGSIHGIHVWTVSTVSINSILSSSKFSRVFKLIFSHAFFQCTFSAILCSSSTSFTSDAAILCISSTSCAVILCTFSASFASSAAIFWNFCCELHFESFKLLLKCCQFDFFAG